MSEAAVQIVSPSRHTNSLARDFAVQFLYQSEVEKIFMFIGSKLEDFIEHFQVAHKTSIRLRLLVEQVFASMPDLDNKIAGASKNWQIHRMSIIDRSILRLALLELLELDTPTKVVIDEAIELAKKYGTETSPAFVNGLLDTLARDARK